MSGPKGYSFLQIRLHWVVAFLILFQLIFGEDMKPAWRAFRRNTEITMTVWAWAHIVVGVAVLAFAIWRLVLRFTRGVPEVPKSSPLMEKAGEVGHWALYLVMLGAPITGLMAWYGGITEMADIHELFKPATVVLVLVHIAAAIYHQFVLKDGLLLRMKKPLD